MEADEGSAAIQDLPTNGHDSDGSANVDGTEETWTECPSNEELPSAASATLVNGQKADAEVSEADDDEMAAAAATVPVADSAAAGHATAAAVDEPPAAAAAAGVSKPPAVVMLTAPSDHRPPVMWTDAPVFSNRIAEMMLYKCRICDSQVDQMKEHVMQEHDMTINAYSTKYPGSAVDANMIYHK